MFKNIKYLFKLNQLVIIAKQAKKYRDMETEDTPRLYKGKKLHDEGMKLSELLEEIFEPKQNVSQSTEIIR